MTRLMLVHGARKDRVNSVGRNAAQMAAFVGMCVFLVAIFITVQCRPFITHLVIT